jgi:tetratricopeptide (TPR) repeat protein
MNFRAIYNHIRFYRVLYVSLCIALGSIMSMLGHFFATGQADFVYWCLISPGVALVFLGVVVVIWFRASFKFTFDIAVANMYFKNGQYSEAEPYAQRAWQYANLRPASDPDHADTLRILTRLAKAQANYDDAESFGQQWLKSAEEACGSDHWRIINPLQELAEIYIEIARYSQAKPLLERSLSMLDSRPIRFPLALAWCFELTGRMYFELGRHDKAEAFLKRAFYMDPPDIIWRERPQVGCDLSFSLARNGRPDAAEAILQAGQDLVKKTFPAESWQWARWLLTDSYVRFVQNRFAEAEQPIRSALAIGEKNWPGHPNTLSTWCSLANILKAQKKFDEAEECYKKALRVCDDSKAPEHPNLASILEDYAELLQKAGRTGEAFELHHRAAQIREFHAKNPID